MSRLPLQQPFRRYLSYLAIVVALAALAFTVNRVVRTMRDARPAPSGVHPTAVVWNDRVFQSPKELTRSLHSHGANYGPWRDRHPLASAMLEHRPPKASSGGKAAHAPTPPRPAAFQPPPAASRSPNGMPTPGSGHRLLVILLLLLAAACVCVVALTPRFRHRFPNLVGEGSVEREALLIELFACAAAVVVAVVVVVTLT
jgi:hypothetical protein